MSGERDRNLRFSMKLNGGPEQTDGKLKRFSDVMTIAKDGILTLAVVIAGAWALLRYDLIESNAAKVKLDLQLQQVKAQIQLSAKMEETVTKVADKFIINGRFFAKNVGSRDIVVN